MGSGKVIIGDANIRTTFEHGLQYDLGWVMFEDPITGLSRV